MYVIAAMFFADKGFLLKTVEIFGNVTPSSLRRNLSILSSHVLGSYKDPLQHAI